MSSPQVPLEIGLGSTSRLPGTFIFSETRVSRTLAGIGGPTPWMLMVLIPLGHTGVGIDITGDNHSQELMHHHYRVQ